MPVYPAALNLWLEVVGCPTVCGHCWAVGRWYTAMPLDRIARVLDQAHAFAERRGLGFGAYPMHEVAAHPQAADVLRLFAQHVGAGEFEPFSTTGVPIAMRDDWLELLGTLKELGSTTVWLAFHGLRQTHDEVVARQGAFDETCVSVERAHAAGLRVGANVFVTKTNLRELDELAETTRHIGLDEMSWEPAGFTPTPRGRRFEAHRPMLEDLAPHAEGVVPLTSVYRDRWANLAAFTETAHRQRALDGLWPAFDPPPKGQRFARVSAQRRSAPRLAWPVRHAARQPGQRRGRGCPAAGPGRAAVTSAVGDRAGRMPRRRQWPAGSLFVRIDAPALARPTPKALTSRAEPNGLT